MNNQSNLFSIECEQSVIGDLLLSPDLFDRISDIIETDCFYSIQNQIIYAAISKLLNDNKPCDAMTVLNELTVTGKIDESGGMAYLSELMGLSAGASSIVEYANIIKERSVLRGLNSVCSDVMNSVNNPAGVDVESLLEGAQAEILALTDTSSDDGGLIDGNVRIKESLARIDQRFNSDGALTGVSTGFEEFDKLTNGLQNSDLIIIGARPSMGKSTLGMGLAFSAITTQNDHVAIFGIEVPAADMTDKMLCSGGKIDAGRLKTGQLNQDEWAKLSAAVNKIHNKNFSIDDESNITPGYIRNKLRKQLREKGKIGMVMIDYLQLITIKGFKGGRQEEITAISRQLKRMAKEFDCPFIVLSQLNRSLEQRPDKRPINSDLRESGAIEQDADLIVFIYRDEVYDDDTPDKGVAEIIIRKHRNGEIGTVRLAFIGKHSAFENLAYNNGEY